MNGFRHLMRDSGYSGPGTNDYADRWDDVFGPKRTIAWDVSFDYLSTQCPQEVALERVPSATYHCLLRVGHDGACVISVIGSDAFHEANDL